MFGSGSVFSKVRQFYVRFWERNGQVLGGSKFGYAEFWSNYVFGVVRKFDFGMLVVRLVQVRSVRSSVFLSSFHH